VTRELMLLVLGFSLIVLEAAVGTVTRLGALMPNLILPIVLYIGMAPDVPLARSAILVFALGLLVDSATGHAMGLMTFVHIATLLGVRAGSLRLLIRGRVSQVLITALVAALGALMVVALRGIFRPTEQFQAVSLRHILVAIVAPSLSTGALAPFVFQLVRRVDTRSRRDESASFT
jgi:rod shape-determining protein MreD